MRIVPIEGAWWSWRRWLAMFGARNGLDHYGLVLDRPRERGRVFWETNRSYRARLTSVVRR